MALQALSDALLGPSAPDTKSQQRELEAGVRTCERKNEREYAKAVTELEIKQRTLDSILAKGGDDHRAQRVAMEIIRCKSKIERLQRAWGENERKRELLKKNQESLERRQYFEVTSQIVRASLPKGGIMAVRSQTQSLQRTAMMANEMNAAVQDALDDVYDDEDADDDERHSSMLEAASEYVAREREKQLEAAPFTPAGISGSSQSQAHATPSSCDDLHLQDEEDIKLQARLQALKIPDIEKT